MARLCGADVALAGLERDRDRLASRRELRLRTAHRRLDAIGRSRRDGLGADGVVDATGVSAALTTALEIVRPAGWISKVGWGPQPLGFSLDRLVQKNITLQGSFSHNWPIWERVIRLIATGELDVRPITGGVWPLAEWQEAFETMHSGEIVKAVLKPGLKSTLRTDAAKQAQPIGNAPPMHAPRLASETHQRSEDNYRHATSRKVILVTGSTTGIGEAIARYACREGASVMLHGRETSAAMRLSLNSGPQARFVAPI